VSPPAKTNSGWSAVDVELLLLHLKQAGLHLRVERVTVTCHPRLIKRVRGTVLAMQCAARAIDTAADMVILQAGT